MRKFVVYGVLLFSAHLLYKTVKATPHATKEVARYAYKAAV